MKKKKTVLILMLALLAVLMAAYVLYDRLEQKTETQQLAQQQAAQTLPAPDFTVYDAQGNAVSLSDYFGKPIVLNFWASWCGPCKMEMPDFDKAYQQLGDEVQFLMINVTDGSRETVEIASEFIQSQGYTFPVFYDTEIDASYAYGVRALPTTYFINADGDVVTGASGAISEDILMQGIDMIR